MKTLLAFVVGVAVSRPLWPALVWLWHEGGVGCAFLDHDANLCSFAWSERGQCYRCGGPLLSERDARKAAADSTTPEDARP